MSPPLDRPPPAAVAAAPSAPRYEVLDAELQARDPQRFAALLAGFVRGYEQHFGGDEAESPAHWPARIAGRPLPQPVMRIVVATAGEPEGEQVVGGIATEYYRRSGAVLATYVYVDGERRHHGVARQLLERGRLACERLGPVGAVLAETEWPDALAAHGFDREAVAAARDRLRFFARIDARLLNFDYVQPALRDDADPVPYLRLLALPAAAAADEEAPLAAAVAAFLAEFHEALAEQSGRAVDAAGLQRQRDQLTGAARPGPLRLLLPRLRMDDVALCLHFAEPLPAALRAEELLNADGQPARKCPVFHSMETDLLLRAHRRRRLLWTACLTKNGPQREDAGVPVEIEFPRRLRYRSENREEERQWPLRRRAARAYLSLTLLFEARALVWHLTLRPGSGPADWFDEVDLIALLKLADDGADQERTREAGADAVPGVDDRAVGFRVAGAPDETGLAGLLQRVGRCAFDALRRQGETAPLPGAGLAAVASTVQWLGPPTDRVAADWHAREALCGVVSGILDYDEIDAAEVADTLRPSVAIDGVLLRAHRNGITFVGAQDRAAATVAGSVGISPYLLVPQAVVVCNEWLLDSVEALRLRDDDPRPAARLAEDMEKLEQTLRRRWLANPFFYPTEQALYVQAMQERGVSARRDKAEDLLAELKARLQLLRDEQRARFEAWVQALLGAISAMAVDSIIVDVVAQVAGDDTKLAAHAVTIGLAVAIGVSVFLWKRPARGSR